VGARTSRSRGVRVLGTVLGSSGVVLHTHLVIWRDVAQELDILVRVEVRHLLRSERHWAEHLERRHAQWVSTHRRAPLAAVFVLGRAREVAVHERVQALRTASEQIYTHTRV